MLLKVVQDISSKYRISVIWDDGGVIWPLKLFMNIRRNDTHFSYPMVKKCLTNKQDRRGCRLWGEHGNMAYTAEWLNLICAPGEKAARGNGPSGNTFQTTDSTFLMMMSLYTFHLWLIWLDARTYKFSSASIILHLHPRMHTRSTGDDLPSSRDMSIGDFFLNRNLMGARWEFVCHRYFVSFCYPKIAFDSG